MELYVAMKRLKVAMELSWKATDVGRACLTFLHRELDEPEARARLAEEITLLIAQISIFAETFGCADAMILFLERIKEAPTDAE
jgi:hypothetical protein